MIIRHSVKCESDLEAHLLGVFMRLQEDLLGSFDVEMRRKRSSDGQWIWQCKFSGLHNDGQFAMFVDDCKDGD